MKNYVVIFLLILLTNCSKSKSSGTCWDCQFRFAIGGPNRDTVICNDGSTPNYQPYDPNGNQGSISCSKQ